MSDDFDLVGADQFLRLSKALKAAGRKDLRDALNKGMRTAAKPLIPVAREAFIAGLPHKGGVNEFIAGKRMRAVTHTGRDPGVSIVVAKQDPRLDSQGRLAHPVFNLYRWPALTRVYVVQKVRPGIFSTAMQAQAPKIQGALEGALDEMVQTIVREAL